MEISLPNEAGRLQILVIHTTLMRNNKKLDDDVNLKVCELVMRGLGFDSLSPTSPIHVMPHMC